jgi:hypothetical protein
MSDYQVDGKTDPRVAEYAVENELKDVAGIALCAPEQS